MRASVGKENKGRYCKAYFTGIQWVTCMRHFCITFRHILFVCVLAASLCALALREVLLLPDGKLHLYFLDIGQGDATFIVTPSGKQILVDGGPDMSTLEHLGIYMPFFDRSIDLVVLTHPNADHMTALPEVLRRYHVSSVLLSGSDYNLGRYSAMIEQILLQKISVVLADPATDIDMEDGVVLDILWPQSDTVSDFDVNNASVALRLLYKDNSVLLPGDIEALAENIILQSGVPLRSTVLKAAHHGSKSSSSTGFLLAAEPELVIVSAGRDNRFGHPHAGVLDRLENMSIPLRSTAKEGTISLTFP